MTETSLVAGLVNVLRTELKGAVIFKHADRFTHGIPDISITSRHTLWWEVKYADPDFKLPGIQELTIKRLGTAAFYVIFAERQPLVPARTTFIVSPHCIGEWWAQPTAQTPGFDLQWLAIQAKLYLDGRECNAAHLL